MASKYNVGVPAIQKMSIKELQQYIESGAKAMNVKLSSFEKKSSGKTQFSEWVQTYNEVVQNTFMGNRTKLPRSTKGMNKQQLQQTAYAINRISNVTETPSQVNEVFDYLKEDILNLFLDPTLTEAILDTLSNEEIVNMGRDNSDFIRDTVGSDFINETSKRYGNDTFEFYQQLIQQTSNNMQEYDESEIEKAVSEWKFPE